MSNTQRDPWQYGAKQSAQAISRLNKSQSPPPLKNNGSVDKSARETKVGLSQTHGGGKLEFNFKIVIRIRPMILREVKNKEKNCVNVQNDMIRLGNASPDI
jgi:hypothetical protein